MITVKHNDTGTAVSLTQEDLSLIRIALVGESITALRDENVTMARAYLTVCDKLRSVWAISVKEGS